MLHRWLNYIELPTDRLCLTGDKPTCTTLISDSNISCFEIYEDRWNHKRCSAESERSFVACRIPPCSSAIIYSSLIVARLNNTECYRSLTHYCTEVVRLSRHEYVNSTASATTNDSAQRDEDSTFPISSTIKHLCIQHRVHSPHVLWPEEYGHGGEVY
jgi:hypothetical protein